jgi:hypothetical protein
MSHQLAQEAEEAVAAYGRRTYRCAPPRRRQATSHEHPSQRSRCAPLLLLDASSATAGAQPAHAAAASQATAPPRG